jgi:hypothetical protein
MTRVIEAIKLLKIAENMRGSFIFY